jgi:hypothetical protein
MVPVAITGLSKLDTVLVYVAAAVSLASLGVIVYLAFLLKDTAGS